MASTIEQSRKRFRRKIRILPELARADVTVAMRVGADEVRALQKRLVPKDEHELEKSINWGFGDAPKGRAVLSSGSGLAKSGDVKISLWAGGFKAFYARWVEFGTHGSEGHPATRAQPFFFPAWRALRRRVKSRVTRAGTKAIKKAAKG